MNGRSTLSRLLLGIALVLFVIAAFVGWGSATFEHSAFLIPAGLASWVAAVLLAE